LFPLIVGAAPDVKTPHNTKYTGDANSSSKNPKQKRLNQMDLMTGVEYLCFRPKDVLKVLSGKGSEGSVSFSERASDYKSASGIFEGKLAFLFSESTGWQNIVDMSEFTVTGYASTYDSRIGFDHALVKSTINDKGDVVRRVSAIPGSKFYRYVNLSYDPTGKEAGEVDAEKLTKDKGLMDSAPKMGYFADKNFPFEMTVVDKKGNIKVEELKETAKFTATKFTGKDGNFSVASGGWTPDEHLANIVDKFSKYSGGKTGDAVRESAVNASFDAYDKAKFAGDTHSLVSV